VESIDPVCRYRPGWVPPFRASGSRLTGFGVRLFWRRAEHIPEADVHVMATAAVVLSGHCDGPIV
jgi:hypothetical protein